ncbi:hypothetical protein EYF80_014677 [Liparis tanakae]|uniref:Uncharacterized protein n=1 Tax=Liparis tanakae TaxID=230148 RepID=A0A4Z2ICL3_9TELE|nr:hypothetical protein EYF80_014677 [Liparis tanakae]
MFSPMKAVTRHIGIPVLAAVPISPIRVSIRPTISSPELAILSSSYPSKLQFIHKPSQRVSITMMFSSMKAVTFHMGRPVTAATPISPMKPMTRATSSQQMASWRLTEKTVHYRIRGRTRLLPSNPNLILLRLLLILRVVVLGGDGALLLRVGRLQVIGRPAGLWGLTARALVGFLTIQGQRHDGGLQVSLRGRCSGCLAEHVVVVTEDVRLLHRLRVLVFFEVKLFFHPAVRVACCLGLLRLIWLVVPLQLVGVGLLW